ncbi:alpha-xenorhabdolysin family binary toxin subunit B [Morganella morganii]|uniref:alpha-xenorhabdolysin family binary toxin subunit B n=1 Tax=Morganella morganii TaxID=582 RepID=UPI0021CEB22C|nr:alpha-xenorhabdolysin family binary toxin subunit B [Morganella morganii]ELA9086546.1 alpha-xenorhabdolysin family binary toxin subunit B [Morganella morganii]MCU6375135.1 alpha-xenorhabdolysin family binary toxin subunit B [Morganella morganii]
MTHSDINPEHITLAHLKAKHHDISNGAETLSLPAADLHFQIRDIKKWQTRILNMISADAAIIYTHLHNFDLENLLGTLSPDTGMNLFSLPHEKQIYEFLTSQMNMIYHSVNNINTLFNTEFDATAIPLLQGGLLHHQSYLDKAISNALPDIDKFSSDKLYWEEKLTVIIQSEEIIHQRGFQSLFGTTTLPTTEELKNVEMTSSERFIMNELHRIISAVINTLTEGLSYAQLVETRTTLSQRINDLSKLIRDLKKDLKQLQDHMQEISNALTLLPKLREFNNLISAVLLFWLQSVRQYEPYFSQNVPLPGLDTLILAQRRYFSVFIGMA